MARDFAILPSLTPYFSSIRVNGAECGAEAILLGAVTSIGGFLFGYGKSSRQSMGVEAGDTSSPWCENWRVMAGK